MSVIVAPGVGMEQATFLWCPATLSVEAVEALKPQTIITAKNILPPMDANGTKG